MGGWVDEVGAGADHRNRATAARQRPTVRRAVDAGREPRHDREASFRERPAETFGILHTLRRGAAAADHGDPLGMKQIQPALYI